MKNILLTLAIASYTYAFTQKTDGNYSPVQYKNSNCKSYFPKVKLEGENSAANVGNYLIKNIENLRDHRVSVHLNYVNESPGGFHYSFTQTFNGIKIYQSEVKLNLDKNNIIRSIFDNSENTSGWNVNTTVATENPVIAIHPETGLPVLAEKSIENNYYETLAANGEIVFTHDLRVYFSAPDSMVSGKIFNPDPLTTAQQFYDTGTAYKDNSDSNSTWIDAQYQTVTFKTDFDGTTFTLKNPYVRIVDFDLPNIPVVTSDTPYFYFDRSQSGFEDVNAYYHISTIQNHIQSLGFTSANGLVEVDPHALNGADNSYFVYSSTPHRIYHGTGGVDDAEDADVCVHEYAHSISETSAMGTNFGNERNALDEGFGDYIAGSYSKALSSFNEYWTFNWDGHNQFWKGRVLTTTRRYPDSLLTSIYRNGEMWASALYALHNEIGRIATDSLILQTHYSYSQNISMRDAYFLLVEADTMLTNGRYYCPIYRNMFHYGFAPYNPSADAMCAVGLNVMGELNVELQQNINLFRVTNPELQKLQMQIVAVTGQIISSIDISGSSFLYQNNYLPNGVYLITLRTNNASKTFKWCKAM